MSNTPLDKEKVIQLFNPRITLISDSEFKRPKCNHNMTRCRPHGAKLCKTVHQKTCGKFAQLLFWEVVVEPNSKRSSFTIVFERPIAFSLIVDISSFSPSESKVDGLVS